MLRGFGFFFMEIGEAMGIFRQSLKRQKEGSW
jgi:hypothetical protein